MPLQYLKDNQNNTTAVVIPINEWEKITQVHRDINTILEKKNEPPKKLKPSDFRGCISTQTADRKIAHIENSRIEWNNNI